MTNLILMNGLTKNKMNKAERYLKEGTVLTPRPEYKKFYDSLGWKFHIVTKEEELQNATIGERWIINQKFKDDEVL